MKKFLICGLLLICFLYFVRGSIDEERRFRQGNTFSRKLRSCGFFCSLKGTRRNYNQTRCYRIPSQNVVVTDCIFKCLRSKGESPEAEECKCHNGVCIEEGTTTEPVTTNQPTNAPNQQTTNAPNQQTTNPPNRQTTNPPNQQTTNPPNNPTNQPNNPTNNPRSEPENPTDNSPQSRRNGNQGKKRVKGQNSKKGNQSKQKS